MEIKLNQYTLALLCALISYITYIIIKVCGNPNNKIQKECSWQTRTERDKDEEVYEEDEEEEEEDDTGGYEEEEDEDTSDIHDNKEPEDDITQYLKRKDSIHVTRKRRLSEMTQLDETEEDKERDDSRNERVLENEDPEHITSNNHKRSNGFSLLEERVERSRKIWGSRRSRKKKEERSRKNGPQQQRDVIAFEDELQAALEKVDDVGDVVNDGIKTIILMKNEKLEHLYTK